MLKSNRAIWAVILCFALLGVGCGDDDDTSPTAPTPVEPTAPDPEPEPVSIAGEWHGSFEGMLIDGEAFMTLEQSGMDVTGDWSAPMPAALVALGAPAEVPLSGPVEGTVEGSGGDLELGFAEAFHAYLGEDCGLHLDVEEFSDDDLEGTWHTEDTCPAHVVDEGTLDMQKD